MSVQLDLGEAYFVHSVSVVSLGAGVDEVTVETAGIDDASWSAFDAISTVGLHSLRKHSAFNVFLFCSYNETPPSVLTFISCSHSLMDSFTRSTPKLPSW